MLEGNLNKMALNTMNLNKYCYWEKTEFIAKAMEAVGN